MASQQPEWVSAGEGQSPRQVWAFTADAPLADLQFARETGETLAADVLGGLYRLNPQGRITCMTRGFKHIKLLAWSDTGTFGAAVLGPEQICRFNSQLQTLWNLSLPGAINALAIDSFGHHTAVSLENGSTIVLGESKQRLAEFTSIRPFHFLRFVVTYQDLLGAANYGVLQRQESNGEPVWNVKVLNTVGDMAITGDGRLVYLAGYGHGIQVFDAEGENHAAYIVKGAPSRLSTSFDGNSIVVATQENFLYRMNPQGQLLWAAEAPEAIVRLHSDPLGRGFVCGFASGRVARFDWSA